MLKVIEPFFIGSLVCINLVFKLGDFMLEPVTSLLALKAKQERAIWVQFVPHFSFFLANDVSRIVREVCLVLIDPKVVVTTIFYFVEGRLL